MMNEGPNEIDDLVSDDSRALIGMTPLERRANDHKIATAIASKIDRVGITDEQRVKLVYNLSLGFEDHTKVQEICTCIKELFAESFLTHDPNGPEITVPGGVIGLSRKNRSKHMSKKSIVEIPNCKRDGSVPILPVISRTKNGRDNGSKTSAPGSHPAKEDDAKNGGKPRGTASSGSLMEAMMMSSSASQNDRNVYLAGDVDEQNITGVISQLISLSSSSIEPINLIISTYGGSVHDMFGLYDTIRFIAAPVRTIGLGKIMSAGVLLMSAGKKGERLIGANCRVMMHTITSGNHGSVFDGINEANEVKLLQQKMIAALANETNLTKKQVDDMLKTKINQYFDAKRAIEYGIADKIIGLPSLLCVDAV